MSHAEGSNQPTIRTVAIGAGAGIFNSHGLVLKEGPFQLIALADINAQAAAARGAEYACPAYTDVHKMLAECAPQVAVVTTPHPFHAQLAIDAMNAGAHVLVEKPIAVQAGEADAMIETAERTGRLLTVSFQQRFRPDIRAAHALIQEGRLGKLQYVGMTFTWPRTAAYFKFAGWRGTWKGEGGGVLLNQAPHNLDMLCHLVGMPSRTTAWTRTTLHNIETEDTVQAMFEWPNGAVGSLHVSTAESGQPDRIEVLGTRGRLELSGGRITFAEFEEDLRTYFPTSEQIYRGPESRDVEVPLQQGKADHRAVYQNLYDAIVHGRPLLTDGREARMSLELANGMILSSHTNTAVEFPLDRDAYAALLTTLQAGVAST